ncbi:MAG: beta-lactamase family protein [Phycisphaeraceae bacterium]|nr:beta-lactamase family protein [Phycisphaeraceae bacterium]
MNRPILAAFAAAILAVAGGFGQPSAQPPDASRPAVGMEPLDLATTLEAIREKHKLPALGAAIVRANGTIDAIGVTGVREAGAQTAVTRTDQWHIGSCTKSMTATLAAMYVQEGKLAWTTTIADIFPDLAADMDPAWRTVTLEQLLTNRSGAPTGLDAGGLWGQLWAFNGTPTDARRALLIGVTSRPPEATPGSKFIYSNAGFSIAGLMIETVAGKPYEEVIAERLFTPLGMTSAGFGAPGSKDSIDQPRGHTQDGTPVVPYARQGAGEGGADNPPAIAPAGRVHLSLDDWARYIALHLRETPAADQATPHPLSAESLAMLHAPARGGDSGPNGYAMGWATMTRPWAKGSQAGDTGRVLTHNGSNSSWFAVCWLAPEKGIAAVAVTNSGSPSARVACDEAVAAAFAQSRERPPATPQPAAD